MNKTTRILGYGLSAALLVACGDSGNTSDSSAETDTETESTTGDPSAGPDSNSGTESESNSMSGPSGSESNSNSDATTTAGTDTMGDSESDTNNVTITDSDPTDPNNVCGDGILGNDETCDDGNTEPGDGCDENCQIEEDSAVCGNGEIEQGEDCDDGNDIDGDGCESDCTTTPPPDPVCGNGVVEMGEECDDGNDVDGDGCQADCTFTPAECGNGIVEMGEACDEGDQNGMPGVSCNDMCELLNLDCKPPEDYPSCDGNLNKNDPIAAFQAIGAGCSDNPESDIVINNFSVNSNNANAWQIAKGFGTYVDPMDNELFYSATEGEAFLMLSSGVISAPNGQGVVTEANGSQTGNGNNNNDDSDSFLPNYTPNDDDTMSLAPQWQQGNNNPNDKIYTQFSTVAPPLTQSFAIDFAFFSSEWPVYVQTSFNDLFVAWAVTDDFTGNISVIDGLPTTITALHPHFSDVPIGFPKTCANFGENGPGFTCSEPQLQGTGFEGHAGTTWVRINTNIMSGQQLDLYFFVADMADSILATGVLIDRFRWGCDECIPVDDPLCTGEVPDPDCCGVVLPM